MVKNFLQENKTSQIIFLSSLGLLILLSFLVAKPFLIAIITGALLAFIFYPIYSLLLKKLKNKTITALITTIIILLFLAIPILIMGNVMAKESVGLFSSINDKITSGEVIPDECTEDNFICKTTEKINNILATPETKNHLSNFFEKLISFIAEKIGQFIISVPKVILNLAITLFTTFYFLRDGNKVMKVIEKIAPIKNSHKKELLKQLKDIIKALVFGTLIIALVQGVLAMLGFIIFSVPNPILWGAVTIFFAIIPFIGAWVVWFPASVYLAILGYLQNQPSLIWKGIGMAAFGLLIISTSDNWLKPIIVGGQAKVHPVLILIGVLGGLLLFGFIGIILGPLIMAILQKVIEIYAKEMGMDFKKNKKIKKLKKK